MVLLIFIQVVILCEFSFSASDAAYKSVLSTTAYCCIELDTGDEILRQGTLISSEYVTMNTNYLQGVTVEKVTCILGANNISAYEPTQKWYDIPTGNIIVHKKFEKQNKYKYNIALIKLPKRVRSTDYIQPAELPPKRYKSRNLVNKEMTGISRDKGSGAPYVRSVRIAKHNQCDKAKQDYGEYNFCSLTDKNTWSEHFFMKQPNRPWILIGFSLISAHINDTWSKQVSCRIDNYLDWIYRNTNIH